MIGLTIRALACGFWLSFLDHYSGLTNTIVYCVAGLSFFEALSSAVLVALEKWSKSHGG